MEEGVVEKPPQFSDDVIDAAEYLSQCVAESVMNDYQEHYRCIRRRAMNMPEYIDWIDACTPSKK